MYALGLIVAAFFIISVISLNWPIKLYHYQKLRRLAVELGTMPTTNGFLGASVYAEINTFFRGHEVTIRFVEGSANSLRFGSWLEIRFRVPTGGVMEISPKGPGKREWGHFRRFTTGDPVVDDSWFIVTDDPAIAARIWGNGKLKPVLTSSYPLEQLSLNHHEVVARLRRFSSPQMVIFLMEDMARAF